MENTIYYTFSTIAQLLGTVVAIVTSFVFFLLQNNRDRLAGLAQNFYDLMVGGPSISIFEIIKRSTNVDQITNFRNMMIGRDYEAISNQMSIFLGSIKSNDSIPQAFKLKFTDFENNYQRLYNLQKQIKRITWSTLIYTSSFILFAVIVLAFTTCLTEQFSVVLLMSSVVLLAINILLYFRLIKLLL